jgi:hypothetical protein
LAAPKRIDKKGVRLHRSSQANAVVTIAIVWITFPNDSVIGTPLTNRVNVTVHTGEIVSVKFETPVIPGTYQVSRRYSTIGRTLHWVLRFIVELLETTMANIGSTKISASRHPRAKDLLNLRGLIRNTSCWNALRRSNIHPEHGQKEPKVLVRASWHFPLSAPAKELVRT